MAEEIMAKEAMERIRGIHALSLEFNKLVGMAHQERLLNLMRKHADEIEELARAGDSHYLVETGDLLILCCEMLLEGGASIDEITLRCFGRYERKLGGLIEAVKENGEWRTEDGKRRT